MERERERGKKRKKKKKKKKKEDGKATTIPLYIIIYSSLTTCSTPFKTTLQLVTGT